MEVVIGALGRKGAGIPTMAVLGGEGVAQLQPDPAELGRK